MSGEVFCHYLGAWIPLGRNRKTCPECGAVLGPGTGHNKMRIREGRR
jgi:hypothetical protein